MAIAGFDRNAFVARLKTVVTASQPVRSIEHLYGRQRELKRIDDALQADGRHAFIYGDRGVGKSSLAASIAAQHQSADNLPISIGCAFDTTFYGTIEELTRSVIRNAHGKLKHEFSQKLNLMGIYSVSVGSTTRDIEVPKIDSMFSALEATKLVAGLHSKSPVVVIDEFDQIASAPERASFASFLKGLGDSGINIKFIFTGVGQSLEHLLGSHDSSYRQLHQEELKKLDWSAREEIVTQAADAFDLTIEPELGYLIAKISNGFPYYVHLITEHLLWQAFDHVDTVDHLTRELFDPAISAAMHGISAQLHLPYNKATLHRSVDYRDIIWATADSESDFRTVEAMFRSYLWINKALHGNDPAHEFRPLPRNVFTSRLNSLKKENLGQILQPYMERRGLWCYRENILRGFVAMKAYEAGIELRGDIADTPKAPTARAQIRPYQAAQADWTPKGIKFRGEHDDVESD